jgi:hypothetical protein
MEAVEVTERMCFPVVLDDPLVLIDARDDGGLTPYVSPERQELVTASPSRVTRGAGGCS